MELTFKEITMPNQEAALFVSAYDWPFHTNPNPTEEQARNHLCEAPDARTFLIELDGVHIAMLRLLDLEDIGDGCPVFDLRVAATYRGRGFGKRIVSWMVQTMFDFYPELHRIEGHTRQDNLAMRSVLTHCGFKEEGQLRETWPIHMGKRLDTMIYGILRSESRNKS